MEQKTDCRIISVTAGKSDEGKRLDVAVSESASVTRSAAAKLCADGSVTVNGTQTAKNYKLRAGDVVETVLNPTEPTELPAQPIPLNIVYEDADILVVNKPKGMVVHPAAGNPDGTLVNALLNHCGPSLLSVGDPQRPGIVHRIDKDTSGLLITAKTQKAYEPLAGMIRDHRVNRIYYAIVIGNMREEQGTVNAPIGRHPIDRKKMSVREGDSGAREAITHWKVITRGVGEGQSFTLLRCELETGRTHQIRVHLASVGHPILGDPLYGGCRTAFEGRHHGIIKGQCLHAGELQFRHPVTGEEMDLFGEADEALKKTVRILFEEDLNSLLHR